MSLALPCDDVPEKIKRSTVYTDAAEVQDGRSDAGGYLRRRDVLQTAVKGELEEVRAVRI